MAEFGARGEVHGTAGVLHLEGVLDGAAEGALQQAWDAAVALDAEVVVLDLARVTYINSTGIALVVGLLARARREGRAVRAAGLTPHYQHIFDITRLSDLVRSYDTVEAAVGGVVELP